MHAPTTAAAATSVAADAASRDNKRKRLNVYSEDLLATADGLIVGRRTGVDFCRQTEFGIAGFDEETEAIQQSDENGGTARRTNEKSELGRNRGTQEGKEEAGEEQSD